MEAYHKEIIENYIQSYNNLDVEGMMRDLHEDIVFENITNGEVDLNTKGLEEFKNQAEQALQFFTEREQTITNWDFQGKKVIIDIHYQGILAIDIPGGAMNGDTLELEGTSEFLFEAGKIISLKDKS